MNEMGWSEPGWEIRFHRHAWALPLGLCFRQVALLGELVEPRSTPVRQHIITLTVLCVSIDYATEPKEVRL